MMSQEQPIKEKNISFLAYIKKYRSKIIHEDTHLPFSQEDVVDYTIESLAFQTGRGLQLIIVAFTPFCLCLFALSFYWNPYQIIRSCSIAGIIGFGTNWIAIKMLFWPKNARPVFGHGLIPSQRNDLIEKITNEVSEKLINEKLIQQKIEESGILTKITNSLHQKLTELTMDSEFQKDTKQILVEYIRKIIHDDNFREQIKNIAVQKLENIVGTTLKQKVFSKIKNLHKPFTDLMDKTTIKIGESLISVVEDMDIVFENIPKTLNEHQQSIEKILLKMQMSLIQEINIRKIITEQLNTISAEQLEQGFRDFSDDKLTFITILGGILGFLGGFIIIWPLASIIAIVITILFLVIFDNLIYWWMRKHKREKNVVQKEI